MPNIIDGLIRAIFSTIFGLIISIVTREIVSELSGNEILGILVSLGIFTISIYIIVGNMNYWGILYTLGWLIGLGIMYYSMSTLIEWYEIILYLGISITILFAKLKNKFT